MITLILHNGDKYIVPQSLINSMNVSYNECLNSRYDITKKYINKIFMRFNLYDGEVLYENELINVKDFVDRIISYPDIQYIVYTDSDGLSKKICVPWEDVPITKETPTFGCNKYQSAQIKNNTLEVVIHKQKINSDITNATNK